MIKDLIITPLEIIEAKGGKASVIEGIHDKPAEVVAETDKKEDVGTSNEE